MYSFGVFLKPLSAEFGWTRAMTSGAYSLFLVVLSFLYLVTGRLTDRFGPRIVLTTCGILLGLGYLLMSQVSTLWHLYLIYGVMIASGMSGGFVPLTSTVARWFVRRRGVMTGIVVSGVGLGAIIMPPVASWLISNHGWRTSYLVVGAVALVVSVTLAQLLRRDPGQIGQLPYGQHGGGETRTENSVSEVSGFLLREVIGTRQFWMLCTMHFCLGFNIHSILVHIVPHATDVGIPAVIASNILAFIGGLTIAGRIVTGGISDRVGGKRSLIIGFAMISVALIWLQFARELWMLYLFAVIFGFGYGGLVALQPLLVAEFFGLRAHGVILGTIVFSVIIGGAIGSLLAGRIFDLAGEYSLAFLVCAVLGIAGLILALLLKPPRGEALTRSV